MQKNQAEQVIRAEAKLDRETVLDLERVEDYPEYWYATVLSEDASGRRCASAYVIHEPTHLVYTVPVAMPPHFNLRSVATGDAVPL